jgi:hypothetical protein
MSDMLVKALEGENAELKERMAEVGKMYTNLETKFHALDAKYGRLESDYKDGLKCQHVYSVKQGKLDITMDALRRQTFVLIDALEQLAKLGNGDYYGNSDGNMIARSALGEVDKSILEI